MKELSDDFVDALLSEPKRDIRSKVSVVCGCGGILNNGYCANCDVVEEVFDCEWCGCCPDPKHCVWSVTCPICEAVAREQCQEGSRVVGLHQERWNLA